MKNSSTYDALRQEARAKYGRTTSDGSAVTFHLDGQVLIVRLPLRVDYLTTGKALTEAKTYQGKMQRIEIQCHHTEYIDSAGLGMFLGIRELLPKGEKSQISITGIRSEGVMLPLKYANFEKIFEIR